MTTTAQGAAKVAQANAQAQSGAVGGAVTSSGGLTTGGNANPKDAPGYVPGSSVDDKVGPITAMTSSIDSAIKSTGTQATPQLDPNAQAPQGLVDQVGQLQKQTSALAAQKNLTPNTQPTTAGSYQQAKTLADKSGVPPPQNAGALAAGSSQFLGSTNSAPTLPASIENFLNPESPAVTDSTKSLLEFLNPKAERQQLSDHIKQLSTDRAELAGLKTDLMDTKRVMAGTEQDLRDEITKAGGFASNSQVQALAIARNKSLIQKAQLLVDQIQSQTDLVNSDVSLVGDEKQMAAQQFTQRMSLMNYQQENTKNAYSALKDSYKTVMEANPGGLYNSLLADPVQAQRFQAITGLAPDALRGMADVKTLETQYKQAQVNNLNSEIAARNVTNQGDPAVSEQTLQGMLNVYKSTGVIPAFGLSAKNPLRAQFYAALGSDGNIVTDANTNKTVRAGLTTAYKTQQNLLSANQTAIGTLDQQLGLVQKYSDQVGRSDSPLVNKYLLGLKSGVFGDPDAAALNNIVKTASYEFAKILSGSAASISGVSVQSAADAESMLNSAMGKGQFTKVIDLMKQESHFRIKSQIDTLSQLEKDLNNVGSISNDLKNSTQPIAPADIPSGYYQASDGLLYKK